MCDFDALWADVLRIFPVLGGAVGLFLRFSNRDWR